MTRTTVEPVRSLPHARLVRTGNALPILAAADLLIGDKSSIALEFSPLRRPIVYFDSPSHHPAKPHLYTLLRATSSTFRTVEELIPKVAAQMSQPDWANRELAPPWSSTRSTISGQPVGARPM
jgi:CDP-glycerol glycerophosphotransferase (TagB/SpsB family)